MPKSEIVMSGRVIISELLEEPDLPDVLYLQRGETFIRGYASDDGRHVCQPWPFERGKVLRDSGNHITTVGKQRVAELIGGVSAAYIDRIAVGDGGLFEGTSTPRPPRNDAVALEHEIVRLERKTVVLNLDIPTVTFVGIFKNVGSYQFAQPGVAQISEVGLYTLDDVLCAIYNFAPLPVDVHRLGFMVEWEWGVR